MNGARRVLIAEDEPQLQELLRVTLEDMGLQLAEVRDVDSLFQFLQDVHPELIVLDDRLGGREPNELHEQVRSTAPTSSVIWLRTSSDPLGFDVEAQVVKPFSPSSLLTAIYQTINKGGG